MPDDPERVVQVIGSLDFAKKAGKILYVLPSSRAPTTAAETQPRLERPRKTPMIEIFAKNAAGATLSQTAVPAQLPSDAHDPSEALIDTKIPVPAGTVALELKLSGETVDTFRPGAAMQAPGAGAHAEAPGVDLGPGLPGENARMMSPRMKMAPADGVTFTVEVLPEGENTWHTIAVGRPTADMKIDRNQFPGAERARVRVLRSTGFEEQVVADDTVDLRFDDRTP
ncbi:hypothetical protein [Acuticoccus sediminis]|uniref:hypothetical protein n=1 Tax=Acuticoccus sediminis TaxID=2184697 RepID=UPI001CFE3A93|nr:hypothetical protein [Acuticoccus sediminis]